MSLTQAHEVHAAVHEDGLNDVIEAFYNSRRRYFIYGSPAFVPVTTANATSIPAISFPGIPGGIDFAVTFGQPKIDLFPDSGVSHVLPPQAGQFAIVTKVVLLVGCGKGGRDTKPTHNRPTISSIEATELEVHATGSITNAGSAIGFQLEEIEIVDIAPESLENIIECIIKMILNAALTNMSIPIPTLSLDVLTLSITEGPRIEDHQVKIWGNI